MSNSNGEGDLGHRFDLLLLPNSIHLLTDQSKIGSNDDSSSVYGEESEAVLRLLLKPCSRSDHGRFLHFSAIVRHLYDIIGCGDYGCALSSLSTGLRIIHQGICFPWFDGVVQQ